MSALCECRMEHEASLDCVLSRLQEYDLQVKLSKRKFYAPNVTWFGHKITKDGVPIIDNKVQGIVKAPQPKNITELYYFLGTLNYYVHFINDLSTKLE